MVSRKVHISLVHTDVNAPGKKAKTNFLSLNSLSLLDLRSVSGNVKSGAFSPTFIFALPIIWTHPHFRFVYFLLKTLRVSRQKSDNSRFEGFHQFFLFVLIHLPFLASLGAVCRAVLIFSLCADVLVNYSVNFRPVLRSNGYACLLQNAAKPSPTTHTQLTSPMSIPTDYLAQQLNLTQTIN